MRADLLALDADKLAALANRGLVKRAQKMLAKGIGPKVEVEGTTVVATDGDVRTELPQGTALADCPCTCPATKVCRHRVAAVLAYQQAFGGEAPREVVDWSPGTFSDEELEARIGKRAFARAKRQRSSGYITTLRRPRPGADAPSAALPTCTTRFLVPGDLAHVRCDCAAKTDCEHIALSVWAFREGDKNPAPEQLIEMSGVSRPTEDVFRRVQDTLRTVALEGVEGAGHSLKATFARTREPLVAAGMLWPADALVELESVLEHYHAWSDTYAVEEVSALLTEVHARLRCASQTGASQPSASQPSASQPSASQTAAAQASTPPASASQPSGRTPQSVVLGSGQAPETELSQVRLVGLGARIDARQDTIRAQLFFADPSSETILVWKKSWPRFTETTDPFSLQVNKVERDSEFVGMQTLLGVRLASVAGAQVVTQGATRRANGALHVRQRRTARTTITPQRGRWKEVLPGSLLTVLSEEEPRRRQRPPRYVRARILTEAIRVVPVAEILDVCLRGDEGALVAQAVDSEGTAFRIVLRSREVTPHAMRAGAQALSGEVRFVAGPLHRDAQGWFIEPLSIAGDAMCVPDLADPPLSDPIMPARTLHRPQDPLFAALRGARKELDALVQRGLRRSGPRRENLEQSHRHLERVGLHATANRMRPLMAALRTLHTNGDDSSLAEAWLDASLRVDLALEKL